MSHGAINSNRLCLQDIKVLSDQACDAADAFVKLYYESFDKRRHVSSYLKILTSFHSASQFIFNSHKPHKTLVGLTPIQFLSCISQSNTETRMPKTSQFPIRKSLDLKKVGKKTHQLARDLCLSFIVFVRVGVLTVSPSCIVLLTLW